MSIYAASLLLIGILLGTRYRVLVLVPASIAALAGAAAMSDFLSDSTAGALLATILALQIGYIVGAALSPQMRQRSGNGSKSRTLSRNWGRLSRID